MSQKNSKPNLKEKYEKRKSSLRVKNWKGQEKFSMTEYSDAVFLFIVFTSFRSMRTSAFYSCFFSNAVVYTELRNEPCI